MTEAEHHQMTLEHRQQAFECMAEVIRTAVVQTPWDSPVAAVTGLRENRFTVIDFNGNRYTVTIEEI